MLPKSHFNWFETLIGKKYTLVFQEQPEKPWTTITYYECNNKQATYDTVKPEITFYYKSTQKPKVF